jgi:hypothetical protein
LKFAGLVFVVVVEKSCGFWIGNGGGGGDEKETKK